jgi:hypothetical protein
MTVISRAGIRFDNAPAAIGSIVTVTAIVSIWFLTSNSSGARDE